MHDLKQQNKPESERREFKTIVHKYRNTDLHKYLCLHEQVPDLANAGDVHVRLAAEKDEKENANLPYLQHLHPLFASRLDSTANSNNNDKPQPSTNNTNDNVANGNLAPILPKSAGQNVVFTPRDTLLLHARIRDEIVKSKDTDALKRFDESFELNQYFGRKGTHLFRDSIRSLARNEDEYQL